MEIQRSEIAWMGLQANTLSEIIQTEKDKYCMLSLLCGIYKQNRTHRKRDQKCDYQR